MVRLAHDRDPEGLMGSLIPVTLMSRKLTQLVVPDYGGVWMTVPEISTEFDIRRDANFYEMSQVAVG